eukprot:g99.t1
MKRGKGVGCFERRKFSESTKKSAADAQKERRATASATRKKREELKQKQQIAKVGIAGVTTCVLGFGGYAMYASRKGESISLGPLEPVYQMVSNLFNSQFGELYEPMTEKLLPDRPKNFPGHVPVLVIDLEQTLVESAWDRRHGWRTVKRPGLDEFLETMQQYYEIVLFSPTSFAIADAVVEQLDPQQKYFRYRLYRESTLYKNGKYIKDLSRLNRPLSRTIIIDDDASAFQLHKENAIKVKPFKNINDNDDTTLQDLIPFLVRLANKAPSTDMREELKKYEGRDLVTVVHDEIVQEKEEAERAMNSGLGGAIRRKYRNKKDEGPRQQLHMMAPASKPVRPTDQMMAEAHMAEAPVFAPRGSTPLTSTTPEKKMPKAARPMPFAAKLSNGHRQTLWEWMAAQQKAAQEEQERLFREQQMRMQRRGA